MSGPLDYPGELRTYGDDEVHTEEPGDDEYVVEYPREQEPGAASSTT